MFGIGKERSISFTPEVLQQLPSAVVLVGIECSGKTSFYRNHLSPADYKRISFDDDFDRATRKENVFDTLTVSRRGNEVVVYKPQNAQEFEEFVIQKVLESGITKMATMVRDKKKAVLDGINGNPHTRKRIIEGLRAVGVRDIACVWMNTPLEECINRFKVRGSQHRSIFLTEDHIRKHASTFTPPRTREGFDLVLEVPFQAATKH